MIVSSRTRAAVAALVLAVGLAGCSAPADPVKIVAVDLTHEIDEHNEARSARETFAPTSTIFASIATEGTGKAILTATWTDPSGKVIADQKQDINPTKPARFEFHIPPAAGAHPLGRYKVVIKLNDGAGGHGAIKNREFEIRITE
jgi:hypothetical protein